MSKRGPKIRGHIQNKYYASTEDAKHINAYLARVQAENDLTDRSAALRAVLFEAERHGLLLAPRIDAILALP